MGAVNDIQDVWLIMETIRKLNTSTNKAEHGEKPGSLTYLA